MIQSTNNGVEKSWGGGQCVRALGGPGRWRVSQGGAGGAAAHRIQVLSTSSEKMRTHPQIDLDQISMRKISRVQTETFD